MTGQGTRVDGEAGSSAGHVVPQRPLAAFAGGGLIGILGGLIGLGGAEFRLPLLIGLFRFRALEAVILNKAMSLIVVATALPFRASTIPFSTVATHWPTIVNLLARSLLGAWCGASWATRLSSRSLYRVISVLLVADSCGPRRGAQHRIITRAAGGWLANHSRRRGGLCYRGRRIPSRRGRRRTSDSPPSSCCSAQISSSPAAFRLPSACRPCSSALPATAATAALLFSVAISRLSS